ASVTYTTFAKHAGIDEKDGLAFDNTDPENVRRYAIRWVTRPEQAQDPRLLEFIRIYQQSPEVKAKLRQLYGDLIDFPWSRPGRGPARRSGPRTDGVSVQRTRLGPNSTMTVEPSLNNPISAPFSRWMGARDAAS